MTELAITKDFEHATLTIQAEFDATPERVWRLWTDPRQLERWWGPPTWPATVTRFDLEPGGQALYHMTGPDGQQSHGWWEFVEIDPPTRLVFKDGFAHDDGRPNLDLPVATGTVTIEAIGAGRSRMTGVTAYPDTASLENVLAMGMEEGIRGAFSQIDALLAEDVVANG
jgi:uncharacterized protein YndB with AHSA1/START domain